MLEQEHVYVRVFESSCASLIAGGFVDAVWQLGSMRGECAGALAWLSDARHVVKVHCADSLLEGLDCTAMTVMPAPWTRVIVGAPKKKPKRGAQFQKRRFWASGAVGQQGSAFCAEHWHGRSF